MSAQTFDDIVFGLLFALVILVIIHMIKQFLEYRTDVKIAKYLDSLGLESEKPENEPWEVYSEKNRLQYKTNKDATK